MKKQKEAAVSLRGTYGLTYTHDLLFTPTRGAVPTCVEVFASTARAGGLGPYRELLAVAPSR